MRSQRVDDRACGRILGDALVAGRAYDILLDHDARFVDEGSPQLRVVDLRSRSEGCQLDTVGSCRFTDRVSDLVSQPGEHHRRNEPTIDAHRPRRATHAASTNSSTSARSSPVNAAKSAVSVHGRASTTRAASGSAEPCRCVSGAPGRGDVEHLGATHRLAASRRPQHHAVARRERERDRKCQPREAASIGRRCARRRRARRNRCARRRGHAPGARRRAPRARRRR